MHKTITGIENNKAYTVYIHINEPIIRLLFFIYRDGHTNIMLNDLIGR